jgi:hypothetical protein
MLALLDVSVILSVCCASFTVTIILYSYLTEQQARWCRSSVVALLHTLRPDAVALVDAWDLSDHQVSLQQYFSVL